jgi:hypothetical protein
MIKLKDIIKDIVISENNHTDVVFDITKVVWSKSVNSTKIYTCLSELLEDYTEGVIYNFGRLYFQEGLSPLCIMTKQDYIKYTDNLDYALNKMPHEDISIHNEILIDFLKGRIIKL